MEEPHSAGIALAPEHETAPAPRATPPRAAASSGAAPKRLHQIVEARVFLPMAVGCAISCQSDKAWEVRHKHKLGPPPRSRTITWSTAGLPCHVAWAHVLKWAWECHEAKTGEACTWDLDALAEAWVISKCGWEVKKTMCVRFLYFQPGVVSTCSVTERISSANSVAAVFRKCVLEFVWNFYLVGPFLRHVSKGMWGCDCWLFGQSLVCHFLENSTLAFLTPSTVFFILHISGRRWTPALVVHCGSEASLSPCTARLNSL